MTSPDHDPGYLLRSLLNEDVEVQEVTADELGNLLGDGLLDILMPMLDKVVPANDLPRRGSEDYRQMLERGATTTDSHELVTGLGHLWRGYRWRGLLDFQAVLIRRMAELAPDVVRDADGNARLDKILNLKHTEEDMLATAVELSNSPRTEGTNLSFSGFFNMGMELRDAVDSWVPHFQDALDAASQDDTDGIRVHLAKLPRLRDESFHEMAVQATFVLGLAHLAVYDPWAVMREIG